MSKNPAPLLTRLQDVANAGFTFYFHFTLNDYERKGLEPGLPPLAERVFVRLSQRIGRERVIWRCDPLLLCDGLSPKSLLRRINALGRVLSPHTDKLVFSFLDVYRKIRKRLAAHPSMPSPRPCGNASNRRFAGCPANA